MLPACPGFEVAPYKSKTITEVVETPGRSHLMPAQAGWEEVADRALEWALAHAGHSASVQQ